MKLRLKIILLSLLLIVLACLAYIFRHDFLSLVKPGRYSVSDRLEQYGGIARARWQEYFSKAQVQYPPKKVTLVAFKSSRELLVYVEGSAGKQKKIRSIPICAASGSVGPKLKEGDRQVPEGVYRVSFLNANSRFHLSLRLNYPNSYDQKKGRLDGRVNLGSDIMIHGNCVSIGCIAIQDQPIEDIFILAADIGMENFKVVVAPFDLRDQQVTQEDIERLPDWIEELYSIIKLELDSLAD